MHKNMNSDLKDPIRKGEKLLVPIFPIGYELPYMSIIKIRNKRWIIFINKF